jgi:hypothetical protein
MPKVKEGYHISASSHNILYVRTSRGNIIGPNWSGQDKQLQATAKTPPLPSSALGKQYSVRCKKDLSELKNKYERSAMIIHKQ